MVTVWLEWIIQLFKQFTSVNHLHLFMPAWKPFWSLSEQQIRTSLPVFKGPLTFNSPAYEDIWGWNAFITSILGGNGSREMAHGKWLPGLLQN